MRSVNISLLGALSIIAVLLLAFKAVKPSIVDLSGTWKINIDKTVPKQVANRNSAAVFIKLKQSKERIFFERKFSFSPEPISESLSFDGKVSESTHRLPNSTILWQKKTHAMWSSDKNILTLVSDYRNENQGIVQEFERKEHYSLSVDKKELKIERITILNGKQDTIKVVYDRE
jgi:hypothetical protein